MHELSLLSQLTLYLLLALLGLYSVLLLVWQIMVLRGRALANPDGSKDDWHAQPTHYGIAFADVVVACPANLIGIALVFLAPRWGFYLLAATSFWWIWVNVMTTATSLRFYNPRQNLPVWLVIYPFGILLGAAYFVWTILHFEVIYA